ncbi:cytochrome P450 4C1-like [Tribolium madens]|uniref:cytochrome P450 4C1-like n=1 Tax=Tribolium madens TaxID=41895 RepID=UPI001CF738A0|nr:cytochrome P450 4C1-like [Tribolium madens]
MYVLVLLCIVFLLWCIHYHWKRWRLFRISWNIPGPTNLPFLGASYLFLGKSAPDIATRFIKFFEDYPDLGKFWMGEELFYIVTKPEYLEIILNHPGALEKMDMYKYMVPVIGNGLISGPVKVWKKHRRIIVPTLKQTILNTFPEIIAQQCDILLEILEKQCNKGEIDQYKYIANFSMDVVSETIFGVPLNAQITNANYGQTFNKIMEVVFMRIFRLDYHSDLLFSWTKEYKAERENVKVVKEITRDLIERKKEQLMCQLEVEEDIKKPFLEVLVENYLKQELTYEELEDEVSTFLLAASDTNATSGSFVLTLLGMHQDIQEKLYDEIIQVLGPERPLNFDDLPHLKYTERTIKESLRLFPGAPFIARIAEEDINLGEVVIPRGSNIAVGYVHLHRSEKYWEEPLKFDPDRFLPENVSKRHPYTWLPFSGGLRNCVGGKFAMMVMKIMIAMVIRKFRVTSSVKCVEDIGLTANIVLKPKMGFKLTFTLRQ